jgi:chitinase
MTRKLLVLAVVSLAVLSSASFAEAQCAGGAGAQTGLGSVSCTGAPAWSGSSAYTAGQTVTHNGCLYKANQNIPANPGWAPGTSGVYLYGNGSACPAAGCNYGAEGTCGSATPTTPPRATATSTTRPRATATATTRSRATATATTRPRATATSTTAPRATATSTTAPRATATATSGGPACAAGWSATAQYNGGAQVSRTCGSATQNYQAAFWTQGNDPCTSSGPAGSGQPWSVLGSCGGSATPTTAPRATATSTTAPRATATATTPSRSTPTASPTTGGGNGGGNRGAYYPNWATYAARNFQPKQVHTSGQANNLSWINYAFGNVTGGACVIGDSFADHDKAFTAADSVDGSADCWDTGCRRGLFHQMEELKALHPGLKVIYSFGGWTWSGGFGAAAANATNFANSCYTLLHDARWNGTFDGIDIDWEYPNACGLSCDTSGFGSYKTLMGALRSRFGSELVTSAITADGTSGGKIDAADYAGAAQYVDWYNLMTYDYFGAWAASGPTAPHSPLTSWTGIPVAGFYSDAAVQKMKGKGVPASKLLLGIGAYGRGWTGVSQAAPGGSATGAAPCTGFAGCEVGIEDYKVLIGRCPSNGTVAGTAYAHCAPQWWSYDTPSTVASKMTYMKNQGLGGSFMWELSGDSGNAITSQLR